MPLSRIRDFLSHEAAAGRVLMLSAALALVAANSPIAPAYFGLQDASVAGLTVLHWINDGLMSLFFLLVGLEIKRELLDGELSTWPRRLLPGVAAAGGMLVPALIYLMLGQGQPEAILRGWAIPTATDIAFALGVLALLGSRIPLSLKVFITALAIIDDLGAVVVIALFYTADLSLGALAMAGGILLTLIALNRLGSTRLWLYLLLGLALWVCVLKSGVHATLAGVALALTIPIRRGPAHSDDARSPLHRLEHALHPWVAFLVIPLFGFANAGVSFTGLSAGALLEPVSLGVAAGLFIGKQLGVFGSTWLMVRMGYAELPAHATWTQLYGIALLCGIGFTMSLFIGALAFADTPELIVATKLGVLCGSTLSGLAGVLLLRFAPSAPGAAASEAPGALER